MSKARSVTMSVSAGKIKPQLLVLILSGAALALISLPHFLRENETRRQKLTLENMRRLASAIERYHLKHQQYPVAADGAALLPQVELPDLSRMRGPEAAPAQASATASAATSVPMASTPATPNLVTLDGRDGWGRPLLIQSAPEGYTFVSYGADGTPDPDTESLLAAARAGFVEVNPPAILKTGCYKNDLIFTMGLALKFPEGKQKDC